METLQFVPEVTDFPGEEIQEVVFADLERETWFCSESFPDILNLSVLSCFFLNARCKIKSRRASASGPLRGIKAMLMCLSKRQQIHI